MKNVMGIIYTNKDDLSLRELTNQRSVAALPLAGRYRVVDFILSSMVNSGVRNVGVIMQRNYRSAGPSRPAPGPVQLYSWSAPVCFAQQQTPSRT